MKSALTIIAAGALALHAVGAQALNWPDRRPIGSVFLANSNAGYPSNPRGWFNDPTVDVKTTQGREAFRTRLMQTVDRTIAILKDMNAQGVITWDLEGEQFPHATTYACDPTQLATLAPEMEAIADEYLKRFRAAGLRVGLCVRPQKLTVTVDGSGAPVSASQADLHDDTRTTELLITKIAYAKKRWGVTLVYIDSNADGRRTTVMGLHPASIYARVAKAHPDVLIVPEHEHAPDYWAVSAPYGELRCCPPFGSFSGTPRGVRDRHPHAFSVINIADSDIDRFRTELVDSVKGGDVILFRSWFDEPSHAKVKSIVKEAAARSR